MISAERQQSLRPWPRWLGWVGIALLIAAIPAALGAMTIPANEYKAWGVDAVDCDGPISVYLFAVPTLLIYGTGAIVNGRYFRNRLNLVFAAFSALLCVLIAANIASAVGEQVHMERDLQACR